MAGISAGRDSDEEDEDFKASESEGEDSSSDEDEDDEDGSPGGARIVDEEVGVGGWGTGSPVVGWLYRRDD
jgi:hypothetical protein